MVKFKLFLASVMLLAMPASIGALPTSAASGSVLSGKTAMFAGDSITYGYMDSASSPRSWALRLQNNYGMTVTNKGQNGHSLSDVRDYTSYGNVDKRLHVKCFDTASYDYVILQGGVNDIIGAESGKGHPNPGVGVEVGSIAATKDLADFDTSTFAGGLERYFYEATTRYPDAKIGFIITYQTPNAESQWGVTAEEAAPYWQIAREICAKWDIPYLDLFDDSYSMDILKADTNQYLTDTLHLNAAGYDVLTNSIAEWMATLQPYGTVDVPMPTAVVKPSKTRQENRGDIGYNTSATESNGTTAADNRSAATSTASSTPANGKTTKSNTTSSKLTKHDSDDNTSASRQVNSQEIDETTKDVTTDKPNYGWLVWILALASAAVLATVVIVAVRSRMG